MQLRFFRNRSAGTGFIGGMVLGSLVMSYLTYYVFSLHAFFPERVGSDFEITRDNYKAVFLPFGLSWFCNISAMLFIGLVGALTGALVNKVAVKRDQQMMRQYGEIRLPSFGRILFGLGTLTCSMAVYAQSVFTTEALWDEVTGGRSFTVHEGSLFGSFLSNLFFDILFDVIHPALHPAVIIFTLVEIFGVPVEDNVQRPVEHAYNQNRLRFNHRVVGHSIDDDSDDNFLMDSDDERPHYR